MTRRSFLAVAIACVAFLPFVAQAASCNPTLLAARSVTYGTRGAVVSNLQSCLREGGYALPSGVTGYYGKETIAAIRSLYKSLLGISWDGRSLGPKARGLFASSLRGTGVSSPLVGGPGFQKVGSTAAWRSYVTQNGEGNSGSSLGMLVRGAVAVPATAQTATGAVSSDTSSSADVAHVSSTNVQIPGIDEPDTVKTDGSRIFVAGRPLYYFLPMLQTGVGSGGVSVALGAPSATRIMPPQYYEQPTTKVINAYPLETLVLASSTIPESGDMLLSENKKTLVVLGATSTVGYDISGGRTPARAWSYALPDGVSVVTARTSGMSLFLVLRASAWSGGACPMPLLAGARSVTIPCGDIWVPKNGDMTNVVYTIVAIDLSTGTEKGKVAVAGTWSSVVSMSADNLYLVSQKENTEITVLAEMLSASPLIPADIRAAIVHAIGSGLTTQGLTAEIAARIESYTKTLSADDRLLFEKNLGDAVLSYAGTHARALSRSTVVRVALSPLSVAVTGEVPGTVKDQFSLDEYAGTLRLSTTVGGTWLSWGNGQVPTANDVYTLRVSDLSLQGSITNLGLTERVYATRFIGPRGYLVTFRQVDPFYVLDLADPTAPRMTGELTIPGYSSYLEPIDAITILGVGQEGSGVKLALFDVSDPAHPREKAKYTLTQSWTEVNSDHHAFLKDEAQKVFFLPGGDGGYVFSYEGGTITLKAAVSGYDVRRALFIDRFFYVVGDTTLTVLDETTWKVAKTLSF